MKYIWQKGSYTVEATFYVPLLIFIMFLTLQCGISFLEECKNREIYAGLESLDLVSEFYHYQDIKELQEEISDD